MDQISVAEFRKDIGKYIDRVARGEKINITRRGKVVAVLAPQQAKKVDLSDMDTYYQDFDYFDEGNAVTEMRQEYRY
jgi:prevent-host-death family protein